MNSQPAPEETTLKLVVPGDLVSTNAETLRAEASALFASPAAVSQTWTKLRLELANAKMVDSVGLNLIVSLLKLVQKRGAKMQITYSSPNILRTLTFTRLDKQAELVKV
jgi:anti-anti-sigma factor